jgi:lysozyme
MTWLKLTSKALYLMQGNTECYLDKVDLKTRPSGEFELTVPIDWFQMGNVPGEMVVTLQAPDHTTVCNVPSPSSTLGIDVSHYQGHVDWQAVQENGIAFAFVKATEGRTWVDDFFAQNWKEMKRVGILRGAYHFFLPDRDATEQANHFLQTVRLETGDLPPVLDLEVDRGVKPADILQGAKAWLNRVEQAIQRQPMVYTYPSFWKDTLGNPTDLADYPLWIAHYTTQPQPIVPGGWSDYTFWQHTEKGMVAGVRGACDRDRFNGSTQDLLNFVL